MSNESIWHEGQVHWKDLEQVYDVMQNKVLQMRACTHTRAQIPDEAARKGNLKAQL